MKRAICVGINDYPGFQNDLRGCVNDANDWAAILEHAGFSVTKILDSDATRDNILSHLDNLLANASDGDEIVFTYSGHGTQVADRSGDEIDGYDEALYVYDGTIIDDELRRLLQNTPQGVHVVVIADSCFSGTVTRALESDKAKPRFLNLEAIPSSAKLKKHFLADEPMVELLLSGCSDSEYSYDAEINGRWNGAMTAYATSVMRAGQTWNAFYQQLRQHLPSDEYPQTPQLEGSEVSKRRLVFATNDDELPHPDPVDGPGSFWDWLKKYWWVLLVVLVIVFILIKVLA